MTTADLESPNRLTEGTSVRNPTIDALKGGLILLVMIGHLFVRGLGEDPIKWEIYGFHMPVFLGLSGLLFNLESFRRLSPSEAAGKYWHRMIAAWLVAFLVFTPMMIERFDLSALISALVKPKFHLWYIPALCFFMAVSYVGSISPRILFALSLCAGVGWMLLYGVGSYDGPLFKVPLPDPRFITMAPFFFFGILVAKRGVSEWLLPLWISLAGVVLWQICFYIPPGPHQVPVFLVTNLAFIALLPHVISMRVNIPVLESMGADSLFFYLWHPLIIFACQRWIYPKLAAPAAFLITLVVAIAVLFAVRAVAHRVPGVAPLLGIAGRAR